MLTDALEAENVRVLTERLSLDAGVDDPAIVMQQLNVSTPFSIITSCMIQLLVCLNNQGYSGTGQ